MTSDLDKLIAIRKGCEMTQHSMANQLGMSLRAYQALEAGESQVRPIHVLAAERMALGYAVLMERLDMCPAEVRSDALDLAALIRGKA